MLQRRSFALLAILSLLPFVLAACSDATSSADPRTQTSLVRVATVDTSTRAERAFTGIVAARVQSDLGFRVPGKVLERLVDTGQTVKRGQPLMRIDPTDLRLATRAQEEAVAAAKARERQTSQEESRYRELVATGAVSRSAYDKTKAAAESARAELNAAEAQADSMRPRPRPTLPATRRATLSCSRMRTAWWSRRWRRQGKSSLPARSSCAWRMPGAARRSSSFPKPCARRSDLLAAQRCTEAG